MPEPAYPGGPIRLLPSLAGGDAIMTTKALFPLLEKLARCRRDTDVSGVAMDAVKGTFACHIGATIFLGPSLEATERAFFGVRLGDVEEYETQWRPLDRVFPAVIARAVPVHNWQVYGEAELLRDRIWLGYARRHRIYHYMSAPIFGSRGRLVGVLNLCRRPDDRRFDATTVEMASAFSGFLSATLSRVSGAEAFVDDLAPAARSRLARWRSRASPPQVATTSRSRWRSGSRARL